MYKLAVIAAILACANAGYLGGPAVAPVAYSAAPAVSSAYIHQAAPVLAHAPVAVAHAAPYAVAAPAIGATHQSVLRSLGGNQAVSHYSKAVDSAFSSVRKFDTRVTNDALLHAPVAVAHAAPVVSAYAAPAYAHAPVAAYAAPAYAHAPVAAYAHAPVAAYAAHAPIVTKTAAVAYSPAAVVSHASFTGLGTSYAW